MQLNLCRSQSAKTLLTHPFGAWLLLFPGFVAALGKGVTIAGERRHTRCARPCGPACGCYSAALRLLASLALRAGLRPLLRYATFARKQNQPSAAARIDQRFPRSPWQFGQMRFIASVQDWQNVHSYEQIKATPVSGVSAAHFSHCGFIFSILLPPPKWRHQKQNDPYGLCALLQPNV